MWSKNFGSKKFLVQKIFGKKNLTKKKDKKNFVQKCFWSEKIFGSKEIWPNKIRLVTAEIALILTNVTRTYVAWKKCHVDSWNLM